MEYKLGKVNIAVYSIGISIVLQYTTGIYHKLYKQEKTDKNTTSCNNESCKNSKKIFK